MSTELVIDLSSSSGKDSLVQLTAMLLAIKAPLTLHLSLVNWEKTLFELELFNIEDTMLRENQHAFPSEKSCFINLLRFVKSVNYRVD